MPANSKNPSPFTFVNAICNKTPLERALVDKFYVPFLANRHFGHFAGDLKQVNLINMMHSLPNNMQYDYLYAVMDKRKRFAKWKKTEKTDDDILTIAEHYNCNLQRAEEIAVWLKEADIEKIKTKKGGVQKSEPNTS